MGVDHRVDDLANHPTDYKPPNDKLVEYIIPLVEIIAEVKGTGVSSKPVLGLYEKVYSILGNEFNILRRLSIDAIKKAGFDDLSFAIDKMRKGQVVIEPGYDGVYGTIKIFQDKEERKKLSGQMSLL